MKLLGEGQIRHGLSFGLHHKFHDAETLGIHLGQIAQFGGGEIDNRHGVGQYSESFHKGRFRARWRSRVNEHWTHISLINYAASVKFQSPGGRG